MDLSIVIVTWNRKALIRDCLSSIAMYTEGIEYESIVVDNGSTDGTVAMIQEELPNVTLIVNKDNLGFSKGYNQGMREVRGRYIVLLNNDTLLRENAFHKLVSYMDSNPEIGAIGPRLLNPDGTIQESALMTFIDVKSALLGGVYLSRFLRRAVPSLRLTPEMVIPVQEQDKPLEVAWLVGACIMVRSEVIERAGLLDENLFMYCEDMEWCYRIKRAGWPIFFFPHATVVHLDHLPTKATMGQVASQQMANQVYFYRKHKGKVSAGYLGIALCIGSLIKIPGFFFLYLFSGKTNKDARRRLELKIRFHLHALKYFLLTPLSLVALRKRRRTPMAARR